MNNSIIIKTLHYIGLLIFSVILWSINKPPYAISTLDIPMAKKEKLKIGCKADAIALAQQAATKAGYSTENQKITTKLKNNHWIIWFSSLDVNSRKKGQGFKVVIDSVTGETIQAVLGQ
ncbi:hypothetical protein [Thalassomonas actiniarum]|uniref:PepSY domain-containing protein n=1 Tax=Thalassomonas actiniarum TaxID=485447 RepID=A0AAF0C4N3_9GAMM|nr:hypothetical protein [Thalassomonas actiniarum]WDE02472.1 hypothetical protein SG35_029115 [Thalassomonas actiniarum]